MRPIYTDSIGNICAADCSNCRRYPAPFRRIGESVHCNFAELSLAEGEEVSFSGDRMVHIIFVSTGQVRLTMEEGVVKILEQGQCVCLARGEVYTLTAQRAMKAVVLSLLNRIEFCEQDIFDQEISYDTAVTTDAAPDLPIRPAIKDLLDRMFAIRELVECSRYHKTMATELFMMIKVLYSPMEHAYFFQSMIQPQDNFRVFICNNYEKAKSVGSLAELAGMSLSVFKRQFAQHFNDSVYHWMMRQKAMRIFADIRDGENSTKALMHKYHFRYYTQFSRFCKTYLQATPAQLITSIKQDAEATTDQTRN